VKNLFWTDGAAADIEAVREFISRDSPHYADLVVSRILKALQKVQHFPESGRKVPELNRPDIREVIVGRYRIVYRLKAEVVEVLTVFQGSRLLRET